MAARKHSVPREIDFLIWRLVTTNSAVTPETVRAFLTRADKFRTVDTKSVTPLDVGVYGMDAQASPDALTMLRVMIFSNPTSVQNTVQNTAEVITRDSLFSKETRLAAIYNLTELVTEETALFERVVRGVLKASGRSKDVRVRWVTTNAMDSLLLRSPAMVKKVLGEESADESITKGATDYVGRLFSFYPEEAPEILALVLSRSDDLCPEVREAAVYQLSAARVACPESVREIVDALLHASTDRNSRVRATAMSHLLTTVEACPENIERVVKVLRAFDRETKLGVKRPDLEDLEDLEELYEIPVKDCADKVKKLVKRFLRLYRRVRFAEEKVILAKGFAAARRLCPSLGKRIVQLLLQDRNDSLHELRAAVVEELCGLITVVPEFHDTLISSLFRACDDSHNLVRATAMAHVVSLGKEVQWESGRCATALLQGCRDVDSEVRSEALRQLGAAAQAWPKQSRRIVHFVVHGCCDDDPHVRRVATEQLEGILRLNPIEAINLLKCMVDQATTGSSNASGSKRKSYDSPCDGSGQETDDNVGGAQDAERKKGGSPLGENPKKRQHDSDSEESERRRPRRR